jgi:uncharacterized protein (DUF1499 family)
MRVKHLDPCPSSPNCVSTLAHDQQHTIAPFRYQKNTAEAQATLKRLVLELPRVTLVEEEEAYLHFEFTSLLLRFVDDVEFLFDAPTKTVHFRSASRIGYGDFGVNRRRMEDIRTLIEGKI